MLTCTRIIRHAPEPFDGEVWLDYESRLLRRKRLEFEGGDFLLDLPEVTSVNDGDAFVLSDGRQIVMRASPEPVLVIRGHLARLAWHIGNRHTPCRIEADRLIIRQDHVLEAMLRRLGAEVTAKEMPFTPEGGAYGHGRTFGHDHGHDGGHTHHHGHGERGHDHHAHGPADHHHHGASHTGDHDRKDAHSHPHIHDDGDHTAHDHNADGPVGDHHHRTDRAGRHEHNPDGGHSHAHVHPARNHDDDEDR